VAVADVAEAAARLPRPSREQEALIRAYLRMLLDAIDDDGDHDG
jgi:hypothetical protein